MYTPSLRYERTKEEKTNQLVSWSRSDKVFFAAGACHILAFTFRSLHADRNLKIIFMKPKSKFGAVGTHVYVLDGDWAFDFNGWTKEAELLKITKKAYQAKYPEWDFEKVEITSDLEAFCKQYNHRTPAHFAYLPWERTYKYIKLFSERPN